MEKEKKSVAEKTAVALNYEEGDAAPKILAAGRGYVAEKILEAAKEEQIPIHKDEALAGTLSKLEIGDYIPKELYGVVAEILVFVDRVEGAKKRGK